MPGQRASMRELTSRISPLRLAGEQKSLIAAAGCGRICYGELDFPICSYSVNANEWQILPSMPTKRLCFSLGIVGRRLCAVGGVVDTSAVATVECFDFFSGTWEQLPTLSTPRYLPLVITAPCRMLVLGGFETADTGEAHYNFIQINEMYDCIRLLWKGIAPFRENPSVFPGIEAQIWVGQVVLSSHL